MLKDNKCETDHFYVDYISRYNLRLKTHEMSEIFTQNSKIA